MRKESMLIQPTAGRNLCGSLIVALALSACGGDGDGSVYIPPSSPPSMSPPSPMPPPAPTPVTGQQLSGTITGLTGSGLVLQVNMTYSVTIPANGTSFTFPTPIPDGQDYSVVVLTQPSSPLQNCVVNNATGTAGAGAANITVACSAVELVYTQDVVGAAGSWNITQYELNENTGALIFKSLGGTGNVPNGIGATHDGKFVYASTSEAIDNFAVEAGSGAFAQVGSIAAGTKPAIPTVDPTNRFLYAADQGANSILEFSIDSSTGNLTAMESFTTPAPPYAIAINPAGTFAYATTSSSILVLSIDATSGALAQVGSVSITGNTGSVFPVIDPNDLFLYTTISNANSASAYGVNAATGNLTSISSVATGTGPSVAAINPAGTFLYVANIASNDISEFAINAVTGALVLVGTTTSGPLDSGIQAIAIDPSGNFLVATSGNLDSAYTIDQATGTLTLAVSTQTGGGGGENISPVGVVVTPAP
jgi:6-phosphogluconolactonase